MNFQGHGSLELDEFSVEDCAKTMPMFGKTQHDLSSPSFAYSVTVVPTAYDHFDQQPHKCRR